MPQGNRPAPHIHLPRIDPQLLHTVHGHGRKRLVQFDDVDIREREVVFAEQFWDGEGGADAHYSGRETRDGGADVFGEDGLVEAQGGRAFHEQEGSGAVGDLGGVAPGGAVAVGWESRADFAEGFECSAPPRSFVFGEGDAFLLAGFWVFDSRGDGSDFVVEPPRFLGSFGALVGFRCKAILGFAGDVEVFADVFGSLAHGLHAVGGVLGFQDVLVERVGEAVAAGGHDFGADGDAAFDVAEADLVGDVLGGFEAGGAEAVDG